MIRPVLKKDWILLWPMVGLLTAIEIAFHWAVHRSGLFGASAVALELERPLSIAGLVGIAALTVATVQQDPLPGADHDWLVRPLRRRDLALAKLVFVLGAIFLPLFVLDLVQVRAEGFALAAAAPGLLLKEGYLCAFLALPMGALAATTRTLSELVLLGAALLVAFVLGTAAAALMLGVDRCPTCGTGLAWLEHLLQHCAVLGGAILIVALQYGARRTALSRAIALGGALLLAFVQVPWSAGFVLQQQVDGRRGPPAGVALEPAAENLDDGAPRSVPGAGSIDGRRAARALLRGDLDPAVEYLAEGARRAGAVLIDVPVRVEGVESAQLLLVDRAEIDVRDATGHVLYQSALSDESPWSLKPPLGWGRSGEYVVHQPVRLTAAVAQAAAPVRVRLDYFLTRMRLIADVTLPVRGGAYRSTQIGRCATDADAGTVSVRCEQIGQAPFCYRATLDDAEPADAANKDVWRCWPDYRPFGAMLSALTFYGVDLPAGGHALPARVRLRIYGGREHFERRLETSEYRIIAGPGISPTA